MYLYEFDEISSNPVRRPRTVIPYAVIRLERKFHVIPENPIMAKASPVTRAKAPMREVRGETRRGFRFTLAKSHKPLTIKIRTGKRGRPRKVGPKMNMHASVIKEKSPPVLTAETEIKSPVSGRSSASPVPTLDRSDIDLTACYKIVPRTSMQPFSGINIDHINCTFDQSRQLLMRPVVKIKRLREMYEERPRTKCKMGPKSKRLKQQRKPVYLDGMRETTKTIQVPDVYDFMTDAETDTETCLDKDKKLGKCQTASNKVTSTADIFGLTEDTWLYAQSDEFKTNAIPIDSNVTVEIESTTKNNNACKTSQVSENSDSNIKKNSVPRLNETRQKVCASLEALKASDKNCDDKIELQKEIKECKVSSVSNSETANAEELKTCDKNGDDTILLNEQKDSKVSPVTVSTDRLTTQPLTTDNVSEINKDTCATTECVKTKDVSKVASPVVEDQMNQSKSQSHLTLKFSTNSSKSDLASDQVSEKNIRELTIKHIICRTGASTNEPSFNESKNKPLENEEQRVCQIENVSKLNNTQKFDKEQSYEKIRELVGKSSSPLTGLAAPEMLNLKPDVTSASTVCTLTSATPKLPVVPHVPRNENVNNEKYRHDEQSCVNKTQKKKEKSAKPKFESTTQDTVDTSGTSKLSDAKPGKPRKKSSSSTNEEKGDANVCSGNATIKKGSKQMCFERQLSLPDIIPSPNSKKKQTLSKRHSNELLPTTKLDKTNSESHDTASKTNSDNSESINKPSQLNDDKTRNAEHQKTQDLTSSETSFKLKNQNGHMSVKTDKALNSNTFPEPLVKEQTKAAEKNDINTQLTKDLKDESSYQQKTSATESKFSLNTTDGSTQKVDQMSMPKSMSKQTVTWHIKSKRTPSKEVKSKVPPLTVSKTTSSDSTSKNQSSKTSTKKIKVLTDNKAQALKENPQVEQSKVPKDKNKEYQRNTSNDANMQDIVDKTKDNPVMSIVSVNESTIKADSVRLDQNNAREDVLIDVGTCCSKNTSQGKTQATGNDVLNIGANKTQKQKQESSTQLHSERNLFSCNTAGNSVSCLSPKYKSITAEEAETILRTSLHDTNKDVKTQNASAKSSNETTSSMSVTGTSVPTSIPLVVQDVLEECSKEKNKKKNDDKPQYPPSQFKGNVVTMDRVLADKVKTFLCSKVAAAASEKRKRDGDTNTAQLLPRIQEFEKSISQVDPKHNKTKSASRVTKTTPSVPKVSKQTVNPKVHTPSKQKVTPTQHLQKQSKSDDGKQKHKSSGQKLREETKAIKYIEPHDKKEVTSSSLGKDKRPKSVQDSESIKCSANKHVFSKEISSTSSLNNDTIKTSTITPYMTMAKEAQKRIETQNIKETQKGNNDDTKRKTTKRKLSEDTKPTSVNNVPHSKTETAISDPVNDKHFSSEWNPHSSKYKASSQSHAHIENKPSTQSLSNDSIKTSKSTPQKGSTKEIQKITQVEKSIENRKSSNTQKTSCGDAQHKTSDKTIREDAKHTIENREPHTQKEITSGHAGNEKRPTSVRDPRSSNYKAPTQSHVDIAKNQCNSTLNYGTIEFPESTQDMSMSKHTQKTIETQKSQENPKIDDNLCNVTYQMNSNELLNVKCEHVKDIDYRHAFSLRRDHLAQGHSDSSSLDIKSNYETTENATPCLKHSENDSTCSSDMLLTYNAKSLSTDFFPRNHASNSDENILHNNEDVKPLPPVSSIQHLTSVHHSTIQSLTDALQSAKQEGPSGISNLSTSDLYDPRSAIVKTLKELSTVLQYLAENNKKHAIHPTSTSAVKESIHANETMCKQEEECAVPMLNLKDIKKEPEEDPIERHVHEVHQAVLTHIKTEPQDTIEPTTTTTAAATAAAATTITATTTATTTTLPPPTPLETTACTTNTVTTTTLPPPTPAATTASTTNTVTTTTAATKLPITTVITSPSTTEVKTTVNRQSEMANDAQCSPVPELYDAGAGPDVSNLETFGLPPRKKIRLRLSPDHEKQVIASVGFSNDNKALLDKSPDSSTEVVIKTEPQVMTKGPAKLGLLNKGLEKRKSLFDTKTSRSNVYKIPTIIGRVRTPKDTPSNPFRNIPAESNSNTKEVTTVPFKPQTDTIANDSTNKPSFQPLLLLQNNDYIPFTDNEPCKIPTVTSSRSEEKDSFPDIDPCEKTHTVNVELKERDTKREDIKESQDTIAKRKEATSEPKRRQSSPEKKKDDDIIPFSEVMLLKELQFRKYKQGIARSRFINYDEIRKKRSQYSDSKTKSSKGRSSRSEERKGYRSTSSHERDRSRSKSRSRHKSNSPRRRSRSSRSRSKHRSSSPWRKGTAFTKKFKRSSRSREKDRRKSTPPKTSYNKRNVTSTFNGFFSWKRKYGTTSRGMPFYNGIASIVAAKKDLKREREAIRRKIEQAVADYRKTFGNTKLPENVDLKVASYLQHLTGTINKKGKNTQETEPKSPSKKSLRNQRKKALAALDPNTTSKNENLEELLRKHLNMHYEHLSKQIKTELLNEVGGSTNTNYPSNEQFVPRHANHTNATHFNSYSQSDEHRASTSFYNRPKFATSQNQFDDAQENTAGNRYGGTYFRNGRFNTPLRGRGYAPRPFRGFRGRGRGFNGYYPWKQNYYYTPRKLNQNADNHTSMEKHTANTPLMDGKNTAIDRTTQSGSNNQTLNKTSAVVQCIAAGIENSPAVSGHTSEIREAATHPDVADTNDNIEHMIRYLRERSENNDEENIRNERHPNTSKDAYKDSTNARNDASNEKADVDFSMYEIEFKRKELPLSKRKSESEVERFQLPTSKWDNYSDGDSNDDRQNATNVTGSRNGNVGEVSRQECKSPPRRGNHWASEREESANRSNLNENGRRERREADKNYVERQDAYMNYDKQRERDSRETYAYNNDNQINRQRSFDDVSDDLSPCNAMTRIKLEYSDDWESECNEPVFDRQTDARREDDLHWNRVAEERRNEEKNNERHYEERTRRNDKGYIDNISSSSTQSDIDLFEREKRELERQKRELELERLRIQREKEIIELERLKNEGRYRNYADSKEYTGTYRPRGGRYQFRSRPYDRRFCNKGFYNNTKYQENRHYGNYDRDKNYRDKFDTRDDNYDRNDTSYNYNRESRESFREARDERINRRYKEHRYRDYEYRDNGRDDGYRK